MDRKRRRWAAGIIRLSNLHRRMLGVWFVILGPELAYRLTSIMARLLYWLLTPLRGHSEAQCRAALHGKVPAEQIPEIARRGFIHRVWDLVDLLLAERLLHPATYHRYGGRIPEMELRRLLDAQRRRQPAILLTCYYGPFDLLPIFLGYNGIQAGVVYRRHANDGYDSLRQRIRARGGCELIPVERAVDRLSAILETGGTIALVADHEAARRGVAETFLGVPIQAMRSIGLLACRYNADVVIAGLRRTDKAFHFAITISEILDHREWQEQPDPIRFITSRYLRGLERIVMWDPAQYLWARPRWAPQSVQQFLAKSVGDSTALGSIGNRETEAGR